MPIEFLAPVTLLFLVGAFYALRWQSAYLSRAYHQAFERLGLNAKIEMGRYGTMRIFVELPEGRLQISTEGTPDRPLTATGSRLEIRLEGRLLPPGVKLKRRKLPIGKNETRLGEARFDKEFVVTGPPEKLMHIFSDSVRSRVMNLLGAPRYCSDLEFCSGYIRWGIAVVPQNAADMRDLVRSVRAIVTPLAERMQMSEAEALLENLKSERSADVRRASLNMIEEKYPESLAAALTIASRDPVEAVRRRALGIQSGGSGGELSLADEGASGGLSAPR